jgi:hypothetical protein
MESRPDRGGAARDRAALRPPGTSRRDGGRRRRSPRPRGLGGLSHCRGPQTRIGRILRAGCGDEGGTVRRQPGFAPGRSTG